VPGFAQALTPQSGQVYARLTSLQATRSDDVASIRIQPGLAERCELHVEGLTRTDSQRASIWESSWRQSFGTEVGRWLADVSLRVFGEVLSPKSAGGGSLPDLSAGEKSR
jgi:hypothetical protein